MGILEYLDKKPRSWLFVLSVGLAVLVGIIDYLTGVQVSFSVFYTIPVSMMAWYIGLRYGAFVSILCTLEWLAADLQDTYTHPFTPYWNALMRLTVFLLIALILSKLRVTVERERKAQQAALLASRVKSEFLANMSHEIRTPMNAVIAMSDLVAPLLTTPDGRKYAEILKTEGEHLLRIINDILDLSKVEAGMFEFEKKDFDLLRLVDRLVSAQSVRAAEKGLTLACAIDPDVPPRVIGDADCLRRVLLNIIGNSIKFTERGEIRVRVERDPNRSAPGQIRFSVSDTGIGISPEKLDVIFERFATADPSLTRQHGGTGLGLHISRILAQGMGGRIAAKSATGRGSTFHVTIPLEAHTRPVVKVSEPPPEDIDWAPALNRGARPIRILLAEDIKSNRVVVEAYLKGITHEMDIAEDGREALAKFQSRAYDLVLMDVQMPVMDGYTAVREIREWERRNGSTPTPIVALTAHALKEEAERSLAVGCDAHLTKPLTRPTLLKCIHDLTRSLPQGRVDPALEHLIPQFLADMREHLKEMEEAVARNDFETVRRLGHGIKGCGGSYGFPELSAGGRAIEEGAKNKNAEEVRARLREFTNCLQAVEVRR